MMDGKVDQDCPLCLEAMDSADVDHPVPCPTKCGFNFCMNCISALIRSSKDAPLEASDGNVAVKVKQNCPLCRADLSQIVDKVLLVRRQTIAARMKAIPDSELTASELQVKHNFCKKLSSVGNANDSKSATTSPGSSKLPKRDKEIVIDEKLFGGLELFMSDSEQKYVTVMMTSGDTDQVARAAQILASISEMSLKGMIPPRPSPTAHTTTHYPSRGRYSRAEMTASRALAMTHSAEQRKEEERKAAIRRHRAQHPLPIRMPRCVTFHSDKKHGKYGYGLIFLDDEWDGSISDAFRRMNVQNAKIEHSKKLQGRDGEKEDAIERMLSLESSIKNATIHSTPRHRVVVGKVRAQAGQLGIQKGDVVTHFNGEALTGTAEDLEATLENIAPGETFSICVNAEPAIAETLRLRSLC
mmetsp:Transcript_23463/g.36157  ORF Transcript_23463/g.36157 Transcript_23463/m.36157 type:complete len:413 (-) Transcript_23463:36-1274(-)